MVSPMLLLAQVKIELRSSTFRFHGSEGLVARGPGDSDADRELQRREESHSKVRENLNTSSEEEEEERVERLLQPPPQRNWDRLVQPTQW